MDIMQDSRASLDHRLQAADALRVGGWVGFWVQLVLVVSSTIILAFATLDPGFNVDLRSLFRLIPMIGGVIALGCGVFWCWQYISLSRQLRSRNALQYPSRASVSATLEKGMLINLVGLILTLIAAQTIVTALLIKTLTIPAGIAVTKPGLLIDSLDIFVVQACLFLIIAGVVGMAIAFWLLKRLHQPA
jgi:hypothetical protein